MEKFLKLKVPNSAVTVTNSGTTTAGTANKLTDAGGTPNFDSTVSVGDIIVDANNDVYKVTAVDSSSVLSVDGGGVPTTTAYTIYSGTASTFKDVLLPVNGILNVEAVAGGTGYDNAINIYYNTPNTAADVIKLEHNAVTTGSNDFVEEFQNAVIAALQRPWTDVAVQPSFTKVIGLVDIQ